MKAKSIFQCAALLTGLLFLNVPLFAAVESDIVGYTTVTTTTRFTLMAVSYLSLSGDGTDLIDPNEIFQGVEGLQDNDLLEIPRANDVSYDFAYWSSALGKWCNEDLTTPTTFKLTRGRGFWILARGATASTPVKMTLAGTVNTHKNADALNQGFTIFSPAAPLSDESVNHASLSWSGLKNNDLLEIPRDGVSYDFAYWSETLGKWCEDDLVTPSSLKFKNGQACWVLSKQGNPVVTFDWNIGTSQE